MTEGQWIPDAVCPRHSKDDGMSKGDPWIIVVYVSKRSSKKRSLGLGPEDSQTPFISELTYTTSLLSENIHTSKNWFNEYKKTPLEWGHRVPLTM